MSYEELLLEYCQICKDLMFQSVETIQAETLRLRRGLEKHARRNSQFYALAEVLPAWLDREMLSGQSWLIPGVMAQSMTTSGTSTGKKFAYWRYPPTFSFVEKECHYQMILEEFELNSSIKVLNLALTNSNPKSFFTTITSESLPYPQSHGSTNSIIYMAHRDPLFFQDRVKFFDRLVDLLLSETFEVISAPGEVIHSLILALERKRVDRKICCLLSNTGEPLRNREWLSDHRQIVPAFCDHMRCWDGGAAFFTCREGVYHLLDNLAWCTTVEERLVSTDYFSVPAPFLNYWNGDWARIGNYFRCGCGRWTRQFEFLRPRGFSFSHLTSEEILRSVRALEISGITQIRCEASGVLNIISRQQLGELEQTQVQTACRLPCRFSVER